MAGWRLCAPARRCALIGHEPARGHDGQLARHAARDAARAAAHEFLERHSAESRALVVVPTLLTSTGNIDELVEALEVRFLANRDDNLRFGLLTDFADAAAETLPGDAALLAHAQGRIEALNATYGGDCVLSCFIARADGIDAERVWMGYERKRGKLADLNWLLRGAKPASVSERFSLIVGDVAALAGTRYVITLDTDTRIAARRRATVRRHDGAPAEPPAVRRNAAAGCASGYGILQPRVSPSLPGTNRSRYARLHSGEPGIDPYTRTVSDVYQDLFDEGSFIGKGIYDVDAFERSIDDKFPENRILSHDLLEGCYARSGLLSDVELFEDYPPTLCGRRRAPAPLDPRRLADRELAAAARAGRRGTRRTAIRCPRCRGGRSPTTCGAAWCRSRSCCCCWRLVDAAPPRWHGQWWCSASCFVPPLLNLPVAAVAEAARGARCGSTWRQPARRRRRNAPRRGSRSRACRTRQVSCRCDIAYDLAHARFAPAAARMELRTAQHVHAMVRRGCWRRSRSMWIAPAIALATARVPGSGAADGAGAGRADPAALAVLTRHHVVAEPAAGAPEPSLDRGISASFCARSRGAPGPSSRRTSDRRTTGCRRTTSRNNRARSWRIARRRPTSVSRYSPTSPRTISGTWRPGACSSALPGRSAAWNPSNGTEGISTTGTTRRRWSRCCRCTSRLSTAAISRRTC